MKEETRLMLARRDEWLRKSTSHVVIHGLRRDIHSIQLVRMGHKVEVLASSEAPTYCEALETALADVKE